MNDSRTKILSFAGSLRKGSFNKLLLRTAVDVAPETIDIEIFDLEGIAPFNQDLENDPNERLKEFKTRIRNADGLLIAVPEYNYSMSGVLKNAIDAASRPYGTSPFEGKPVAIMGASIGMIGTARAQYHLRQSMVCLNAFPLNLPEVMVPFAESKFDENGRLLDEKAREKIKELVVALVDWINKLK